MSKSRFVSFALVFLFIVVVFIGCRPQSVIADLKDEFEFSQERSHFFIVDFLSAKAEVSTREGWSRLKPNGSRLGVYPRSTLNLFLSQRRPLYLVGICTQPKEEGFSAASITIQVNLKEIGVIELDEDSPEFFELPISEEVLLLGHNTIEFVYAQDKQNSEAMAALPENKRVFSVVFQELVISSHPRLNYVRNIFALKERILREHEGAFVQYIPGEIDFYLDLPSLSSLTAEGEFYPVESDPRSQKTFHVKAVFQQIGEKETVIQEFDVSKENPVIQIKKELTLEEGPVRIRLSVQASGAETEMPGFIIWKNASIRGSPVRGKKDSSSQRSLKTLRSFLSEKNTVIIILDAARADRFSTYGHFRPTTPRISEFSREGTLFKNAFSESLSTRSSIATLFTGFPLSVTTVRHLRSRLPDELKTLAEHFKTVPMRTTGFTGVGNIGSVFGFTQGFDEYFELYKNNDFYRKSQEYLPYLFPWLEKNSNEKYFLYIHFKEPHAHYSPLPPFLGMFSGEHTEKIGLTEYKKIAETLTNGQVEYIRACYDETLASVDSVVGELLDRFRSTGLLERSLIILTSDHGELLGEHGRIFGHGKSFADEGIHIPLIIRFPDGSGIEIPKTIEAMVKTSDIFATMADIYRFEIPFGLTGGKSILPLLVTPFEEINPYIVVERAGTPVYCFRTGTHKLLYSNERFTQFFNLENDPEEEHNLFSEENILAQYYMSELKKWITGQKLTRSLLIGEEITDREIDQKQIDQKTLDNLRTLGYIK